jgi:hypothetical protein
LGVLFCRTFQGGMSVQIVKKVNVKLCLGNRRYSSSHSLPGHGVQASGHLAHDTRRVGWVNPRAGLDVLGNGKIGNRVFCVKRRNVETLEAAFSHLKAKCHAAN